MNIALVLRALSLALTMSAVFFAPQVAALGVGDAAPAIVAKSTIGKSLQPEDLKGRVVYLDFWASWCTPCKQSFPWMNAMAEKYGKDGLTVLAVNVDKREADAEKFLKQVPAKFEIAMDPENATAKLFKVKAMPTSVLIDGNGKVLYVHDGFRASDTEALEAQIKKAVESQGKMK